MNIVRVIPIALLAVAGNASAVDHAGASPAAHMEIKDGSGTIVCFAYDTDPAAAPIATGCPEGTYTEQLFDEAWSQTGDRSVVIGAEVPSMAGSPVRVERTCVWDEADFRDTFSGVTQGDNFFPFCSITCPEGVAIDGEAFGSIPRVSGTDDAILEGVSFTQGTGQETITIFVLSDVPLDVVFDRFNLSGDPENEEGFGNLTYEIEAAAVCL